jgi:hypothetical protein
MDNTHFGIENSHLKDHIQVLEEVHETVSAGYVYI